MCRGALSIPQIADAVVELGHVPNTTKRGAAAAVTDPRQRCTRSLHAQLTESLRKLDMLQENLRERLGDLSRTASDEHRGMLNQAVFRRICVHADEASDVEFPLAADEAFPGGANARGPRDNRETAPDNR